MRNRLTSSRCGRQRERKRRAQAHLALHRNPATMQLDELARERQPEPSALHLLVCRTDLSELLEDRFLILRRDTDTRVGNRDLRYAFVDRRADIDPAALGRELQGVDRKSTRLNSSHLGISYAVFC